MYNTNPIKKPNNEHGFSLIELAIVLVLIGLVIAPAISIYHTQRIKTDWDRTEANVDSSVDELGRFRSVHGRYPCPASETAVPGDLTYGHEDCTVHPFGTCVGGTCTYTGTGNAAGETVLSGSLPFKALNLQESVSFDRYLNRLDYVVTLALTSSATFDLAGGGISIVDKTNTTIIEPADKAHFIVLTHGQNQYGGTTKSGLTSAACLSGTLLEQENCDIDSTFLSGEIDENFDDRLGFFSGIALSEWQVSEANLDEIHLKNASNIAVGSTMATDLSAAEQASVRTFSAESGSIIASDADNVNEGRFHSETICEYDATDPTKCFAPRLFAGNLTAQASPPRFEATTVPGSGMSCYIPGVQDEFLVGIENGAPICDDEIYISCPNNTFITGVDTNGNVECASAPRPRCDPENLPKTCGGTGAVPDTADGVYAYLYSGECRKITNYDAAYFTAQIAGFSTVGQVNAMINQINAETRTIEDCGPGSSGSQVRDNYQCEAGTWDLKRSHERRYPWNNFPSNPTAGSPWPVETSYNGADPGNSNQYHDCWCREDYRLYTYSCPSGLSGTRIRIRKHTCPQTAHYWSTVLDTNELCGCAPYTLNTTQSCNSYYDETNSTSGTTGLIGTVYHTFDVTCSGDTPVVPATPTTTDATDCACPVNTDTVVRSYCATGTTNSWNSIYGPEAGVSGIDTTSWICPGTTTGGLPDPGAWGPATPHSPPAPACTCDTTLTSSITLACGAGLEGTGVEYLREWDCTTNNWELQGDWDLVADNCHTCTWRSAGTPSSEEFPYGGSEHKVGKICSCGSSPTNQCWDYGSPDYDVWTSCPCVAQVD
ncbi:MAG: hypothetical protein COA45_05610 [Zetaproteobacteria bacterium]|nr:MAG: hypothetical protein COA45_05610 [Zetaproteobacteria bacterium]